MAADVFRLPDGNAVQLTSTLGIVDDAGDLERNGFHLAQGPEQAQGMFACAV